MITKRFTKIRLVRLVFGCLFAMINILGVVMPTTGVMADEIDGNYAPAVNATEGVTGNDLTTADETATQNEEANLDEEVDADETQATSNGKSCQENLGAIGWLVCPATGAIAKAVDWLYEKIETILVINPSEMKDGAPIYEIWKYMRGITNIGFIIFLLVMVYSQLTGLGISNYGLKKTLPKLIVGAILVNLSFAICTIAVDASNIVGSSLRGLFETIEANVVGGVNVSSVTLSEMYAGLGGVAGAGAIGTIMAVESGAIWMLIPTVLGAMVAVVIGLVTIALRQAVVALLIMIAPLAVMAYILPNTEQWFRKWRQLLFKMLIFYPMFSLLFGASSLAGFAIIASASDGFMLCLGIAVQIFPLFFSWSLMRMSGTFLSAINTRLTALAARPLMANRAWAESHRNLTNAKNLARGDVYTPSLRLRQFLSDRQVAREDATSTHVATIKNRGLAYGANSHYDKDGKLNRDGESAYAEMTRNIGYEEIVLRHKNNFEEGVGGLGRNAAHTARLNALDADIVRRADRLKMEMARSEQIQYRNARGFHDRMEDAINYEMDRRHEFDTDDEGKFIYKMHDIKARADAASRYADIAQIMNGNEQDINYAAAYAAHNYNTQSKIMMTKMQSYADLIAPTRDLELRLSELTTKFDAGKEIDSIIPALRALAMRGDTDIIRKQIANILNNAKFQEDFDYADLEEALKNNNKDVGIHLGTHASQSLASFLMFDVGDKDPALKRLGKYINLETAHAYNENERKNTRLTLEEYLRGEYDEYVEEYDSEGNVQHVIKKQKPKRGMTVLLEGTSFDNVERTAYRNLDEMLMDAYRREDGSVDVEAYLKRREEIETAIGPQFISASLKYLSGSEQLKSAVDFLTGYKNGKERWHFDPTGETKNGELAGTEEDSKYAEAYFRRKTEQYFKDQTPTQILGLRTDYREPVTRHLMESLFEANPELREEYNAEMANIQNRYGDLDADKADEMRKADIKALRMKYTGDRLREILDKSGKLEQIYRTRRSGAANNAKDWLRDWLRLNDENMINQYLYGKQNKRDESPKRQVEKGGNSEGDDAAIDTSYYSDEDRSSYMAYMDRLYDETRDQDENVFVEEARKYLLSIVGEGSMMIALFDDYIKGRGEHNIDNRDLNEQIKQWLGDPDNY